jgi:Zn finger protein HypA/HybF involved in hydrogenase expression
MNGKEIFVEKSNKIHGNKYNYSRVNYLNNKTKVEILCNLHGSFYMRPDSHTNGQGCKRCSIDKRRNINRVNVKTFISNSIKFHGNKYDYSPSLLDYVGMRQKVSVKCNSCKTIFKQRAYAHTRGQGCPVCANNKILSTEKFIEKSKRVHGNRYDYSNTIYTKTLGKVKIKCLGCNTLFSQRANDHLNGSGCSYCNKRIGQSPKKLSTPIFIGRSKSVHGDLYNYDNVNYTLCQSKVKINCNVCGSTFLQSPLHHMNGHGCPNCAKTRYISKMENEFLTYLKIPDNKSTRQICLGNFVVDAVVENVVYEFLGDFWHGNPKKYNSEDINVVIGKKFGELFKETGRRLNSIKDFGFSIKYIWESDWKLFKSENCSPEIKTFNQEDFKLYD